MHCVDLACPFAAFNHVYPEHFMCAASATASACARAASAAAAAFFRSLLRNQLAFAPVTKTNRLHARAKLDNLDNLVMRFQKSLTRHPPQIGEIAELMASADIHVRCVPNFQ